MKPDLHEERAAAATRREERTLEQRARMLLDSVNSFADAGVLRAAAAAIWPQQAETKREAAVNKAISIASAHTYRRRKLTSDEREDLRPDNADLLIGYGERIRTRLATLQQYLVLAIEPEEIEDLVSIEFVHARDVRGRTVQLGEAKRL